MSSISSVSGSYGVHSGSTERSRGRGRNGLEQDLQQFLSDQGVDSTSQQKILTEIQQSLKTSAADGNRPSQSTLKQTIQSVLQNNGVDGTSFVNQIPDAPPGGPRGPGGPHGAGGPQGAGGPPPKRDSDSDDAQSNDLFLKFLLKQLDELQKSSSSSSSSTSSNAISASQSTAGTDATSTDLISILNESSSSSSASNSGTNSDLSQLQQRLSQLLGDGNSPYSSWAQLLGSLSSFDAQA
ncbi:MAG: hypothetical protein U0892_09195 [Pirellulales bacterium]